MNLHANLPSLGEPKGEMPHLQGGSLKTKRASRPSAGSPRRPGGIHRHQEGKEAQGTQGDEVLHRGVATAGGPAGAIALDDAVEAEATDIGVGAGPGAAEVETIDEPAATTSTEVAVEARVEAEAGAQGADNRRHQQPQLLKQGYRRCRLRYG